jgi:hypothetical protein
VWEYAKTNGFSIVTADADFYDLAIALGSPPKVIWLRGCDYPTGNPDCGVSRRPGASSSYLAEAMNTRLTRIIDFLIRRPVHPPPLAVNVLCGGFLGCNWD